MRQAVSGAALLVFFAFSTGAECPVQEFTFRGRVVDRADTPLSGVTVACVVDGEPFNHSVLTDASGSFLLRVTRDTHAGVSCRGGDKCRPAENLEIYVRSSSVQVFRHFNIRELRVSPAIGSDDIEVPQIIFP
jgi:hypothetical protein